MRKVSGSIQKRNFTREKLRCNDPPDHSIPMAIPERRRSSFQGVAVSEVVNRMITAPAVMARGCHLLSGWDFLDPYCRNIDIKNGDIPVKLQFSRMSIQRNFNTVRNRVPLHTDLTIIEVSSIQSACNMIEDHSTDSE